MIKVKERNIKHATLVHSDIYLLMSTKIGESTLFIQDHLSFVIF